MTTYNTLLLDTVAWDLVLDSFGNIALASPPYALAQDVASAIRTFLGEVYYDASLGIPYFQDILGQLPPMALFIAKIEAAALTVPGVVQANCSLTKFTNRGINGALTFVDENNSTQMLDF